MTKKNNFYLPILNELKARTNLSEIQKKLSISKQQLNYYIRQLKKFGLIMQKGRGYYEVVKGVKDQLMYDNLLSKDFIRGHGYVWTIKLPKEIVMHYKWKNRINELKNTHYILVGNQKNIPRIKVLGRKVWLCNNHIRIFDKKGNSYYGKDAIEVRKYVFNEVSLIVDVLNNKLGVSMNTLDIEFNKEHYALIKNDLAIEHNKKGEQLHIKDKFGEWLLIDDSLGEGGELENIGKDAFKTNIPMQKWWNNNKETGFKVTPEFILNGFKNLIGNQKNQSKEIGNFAVALNRHIPVYEGLANEVKELKQIIKGLKKSLNKK